ncbi:hypothetical protein RUM44_002297 [Polyplax serrata]|uniref:Uncharacterized protein n=1 Tax=Polyplax serrata TaxID=468196 RepID=A0ABR1AMH4_POLSC
MIFCEFGHVAAFHTYMRHKFGILQLDGMICTLDYKEIMMKVKDTTKASKSVTKVKHSLRLLIYAETFCGGQETVADFNCINQEMRSLTRFAEVAGYSFSRSRANSASATDISGHL